MTEHNVLVLSMAVIWLIANFLGAGFTVRRIHNRRKVEYTSLATSLPIPSPSMVHAFERAQGSQQNRPFGSKEITYTESPDQEYSIHNKRERLRDKIALRLTYALIITSIAPALAIFLFDDRNGDVRGIVEMIFSAVVGINGTIVGFYFGQKEPVNADREHLARVAEGQDVEREDRPSP